MSAQDVIADVLVEHHYVAGIFGTAICNCGWEEKPGKRHPLYVHADHLAEQVRSAQDVIADVLVEHHYVAGIFGTAICNCGWEEKPGKRHPRYVHADHLAEQVRAELAAEAVDDE